MYISSGVNWLDASWHAQKWPHVDKKNYTKLTVAQHMLYLW